jgi:hypothetical protein
LQSQGCPTQNLALPSHTVSVARGNFAKASLWRRYVANSSGVLFAATLALATSSDKKGFSPGSNGTKRLSTNFLAKAVSTSPTAGCRRPASSYRCAAKRATRTAFSPASGTFSRKVMGRSSSSKVLRYTSHFRNAVSLATRVPAVTLAATKLPSLACSAAVAVDSLTPLASSDGNNGSSVKRGGVRGRGVGCGR